MTEPTINVKEFPYTVKNSKGETVMYIKRGRDAELVLMSPVMYHLIIELAEVHDESQISPLVSKAKELLDRI